MRCKLHFRSWLCKIGLSLSLFLTNFIIIVRNHILFLK